jgi:hypothetical protein
MCTTVTPKDNAHEPDVNESLGQKKRTIPRNDGPVLKNKLDVNPVEHRSSLV